MMLKTLSSNGCLRVLLILLVAVFLAPTSGTSEQGKESEATIWCKSPAQPGPSLTLSCNFTDKSGEALYLFVGEPILEGPGKNRAEYVFLAPGGNRFENVLQYHEQSKRGLDLPIPFHPTIHLKLSDLRHLRRIEPKETVRFEARWEPHASDHPGHGAWMARVKLLYLPHSGALELLGHAGLSPACKSAVSRSIQHAQRQGVVTLVAKLPGKDRNYSYDGCRDVISEKFHYLFSNTVTFTLTGD